MEQKEGSGAVIKSECALVSAQTAEVTSSSLPNFQEEALVGCTQTPSQRGRGVPKRSLLNAGGVVVVMVWIGTDLDPAGSGTFKCAHCTEILAGAVDEAFML